ncbi:MAG: hypothetical protein B1H05_00070 [Candidatus Cloacimonas sp. 4484_140]|nr:MAG: hypothetical protein B1H05_00070 [Candidatus Cloacimonas sp. 4484_140]
MKYKFLIIILILILLSSSILHAEKPKSKALAALMSFAVPGTGELYAKNTASGVASLATETLLWLGYFGLLQHARWAENDYKKYALAYSNTHVAEADDLYYTLLQDYYTSDEYNNHVYLYARNALYGFYNFEEPWTQEDYDQFLEEYLYVGNEAWDWGSKDVWYKYGELRREKNKYNIISKFTIAGMLVNRLVSMVKAVHSVHLYNKGITKENTVSLNCGYDHILQRFSLSLEKRF